MHRENTTGPLADDTFQLGCIHQEGVGVDVDKDRLQVQQGDHLGRGHERKGSRDHLVARLQIERHQRDL